ncbi:MAG TPA: hypothetical protein VKD90_22585 [Gemmataceae bacterium]|nr:hypothetical protein [Gemmataceae bacterium]
MRIALAALILGLAAQTAHAKLEIRDVQAAHGQLGPERDNLEYLPGDEVFFRFTVTGARTDDQGRLSGEIRITLTDAVGKVVLTHTAQVKQLLAFGGGRVPAKAILELGHQFLPGSYELAVEFKDTISGESDGFKKQFTVKPLEFALVRVRFAHDEAAKVPARIGGVVGQTLHMKVSAVGFDRTKGEVDLEMEIRVLDKDKQPVAPQGVRATVRNTDPATVKAATHVTFNGELTLTRPGDFILRLAVTDKLTKKTVTFESPLKVTE